MTDLLDDRLNLLLLKSIVSGEAESVNLNCLSKTLKKHRNTVRKKIEELFSHKVINPPIFPFTGLYREYPLLVIVRADLPYDDGVSKWIADDAHIFAAYRSRYGEYNTLLILYHKDVKSYQLWREPLTERGSIPQREGRYPSSSLYFSNQLMAKYEPHATINLLEDEFKEVGKININGYVLDELSFQVLKCLVTGKGIKLNEKILCEKLEVHRKTIARRISQLLEEGLVSYPICRFPNFFTPPNYILTISLVEVKKSKRELIQEMIRDPHVTIALNVSHGRYNLLLFGSHRTLEEHEEWQTLYDRRFPDCVGDIDTSYLSPKMTISVNQQKVSLDILEQKILRMY